MNGINSRSTKFFEGRVEVRSLELTDQPATRAEVRARIASPKGELAVLLDEKQVMRFLAYLELKEGVMRGGHYHKVRHEYFYLIAGEAMLRMEEVESGKKESARIAAGDLVYIAPGVAHAYVPSKAGHGVEFAAEEFDMGDVYRFGMEE